MKSLFEADTFSEIKNILANLSEKSIYSDKPWRNGLPSASGFKVTDEKDFNKEKEVLESMINAFHEKKSQTEWNPHPVFGKFTAEQWGKMQYKHLDHHLRQFGV